MPDDFDDLWAPFAAGVGRSGSLLISLDANLSASARAARNYLGDPAGPFTLTARAWYAVGRVPSLSR